MGRLLQHSAPSLPADDDRLWALTGLPAALADDPGLLVANARRMWRDGRVADAVAAFRQAEALMDEPEFRAHWADERAVVATWLPTPSQPGLLPSPDRGVRLARELRLLLRSVPSVGPASAWPAGSPSCCPAGGRTPGRPCCGPSTDRRWRRGNNWRCG